MIYEGYEIFPLHKIMEINVCLGFLYIKRNMIDGMARQQDTIPAEAKLMIYEGYVISPHT